MKKKQCYDGGGVKGTPQFTVPKRAVPTQAEAIPRLTYSIPEAAEATGISVSGVKRLVKTGEVPSVLLQGRRLIPVAALAEIVSPDSEPS